MTTDELDVDLDLDVDVVVVGAGLAGLVAARGCAEAGLGVRLVEAGDRVGGRVRSESAGGRPLDLGAEWVAPASQHAVMAEVARYGLELEEFVDPGLACWALDGSVRSDGPVLDATEQAELDQLYAEIERDAARIDVDDPRWYERVADLDVPMSDYLDRFGVAPTVRSHVLLQSFSLTGADETRYGALSLLHEIASFGSCADAFSGEDVRVRGGTAGIAAAIAADLGPDVISYGTAVRGIRVVSGGRAVEVTTAQETLRARVAIVTVPLNVLRHLHLDVGLGDAARAVVGAGHAGSVAKAWTRGDDVPQPYRSIGWPDVPESYGVPTAEGHQVAAFQLAPDADTYAAARQAVAELRRRHPRARFADEVVVHDWLTGPHSMGTWCAATAGQQAGLHDLAAQPAPCLFAGGDVSRRWAGWMDGALTSGVDAAARAIAFVRDGTHLPVRG